MANHANSTPAPRGAPIVLAFLAVMAAIGTFVTAFLASYALGMLIVAVLA